MAELGPDIFFATIPELNKRLVAKEVSAEEVARAFTARLEQFGPRYNTLTLQFPQQTLRAAKAVDADLKRDRLRGPLQGVPYGAKDALSVAGQITTWGAKPFAAQVFDYTATVIQKLESTGALLTGKLSMVELGGAGAHGSAMGSLIGPQLNPWDRSRWSGGSGAATAAGLTTFELGSETADSIVTSASYCGLSGLRPTYGLVSCFGAMPCAWTVDRVGPLAHTVEDCGVILQVIAGKDSKDPGSAGKSFYYTPQYMRPLKEIKVGYAPADFSDRAAPSARAAFAASISALKETGVELVETKLPNFRYETILAVVMDAEQGSVFEPLIRDGEVNQLSDQQQIAGLKASLGVTATDYLKAMRLRRMLQDAFGKLFSEVDALVSFAQPGPAPVINQPPAASAPGGFSGLIEAGNLAGLPAVVFPCGFADNLPIALQVAGSPFSENTILSIARGFQSATDWHKRRPNV